MAIRNVRLWPHPDLRVKAESVEDVKSDEVKELITDLIDTMQAYGAQGLAATQIGVPLRVIAIKDEEDKVIVLINPKITSRSDEKTLATEGCLSFPGVLEKIKRHNQLTVSALDDLGHTLIHDMHAVQAVAIQHELDHLDGVVMLDHMGRLQRRLALKRLRKVRKQIERGAAA